MRLQQSDDVTAQTLERPETRLVLAISLDGRLAPAEGGAAQLGGQGDRRVLDASLAWADASLMGAGTLRAHESTCLIRDRALLQQRVDQGRSVQPAVVVVSRNHDFPQQWRFFRQPLERWLLAPKAPAQGFDRWIPLGSSWPDRLGALRSFGVRRLVLLGGASLAAELLQADCVDALQLTLVPTLLGGAHTWFPVEQGLLPVQMMGLGAWGCDGVEDLGDGEMMLRYRRQRLH